MHQFPSSVPLDQPDARLLHKLFFVQQVCLVLVVQIAIVAICARAYPPLATYLPAALVGMGPFAAVSALLCALGLIFSESEKSQRARNFSRFCILLSATVSALAFVQHASFAAYGHSFLPQPAFFGTGAGPITSPAAFLLLTTLIFFVRAGNAVISRFADALAFCLCLLVLILGMEFLFRAVHVADPTSSTFMSNQTLACLTLLTVVTLLRRAEHGVLSFFLGTGMGSRVSRILMPVILVLPFLREVGRAHLLGEHLIPPHYTTAVLTSVATLISIVLLILVASLINKMQTEIQDLSLRDELTGLYNVRGFNLLAEQAMRLAVRAKQDFGVLFIDLDNLKQINDRHGHNVGSASIVETAKLLHATFRETDVIGRIGGDEFVVAGQFDEEIIERAIARLKTYADSRSSAVGRHLPLSFSLGYAATEDPGETVKELVARADKAMYDDKRLKKLLAV